VDNRINFPPLKTVSLKTFDIEGGHVVCTDQSLSFFPKMDIGNGVKADSFVESIKIVDRHHVANAFGVPRARIFEGMVSVEEGVYSVRREYSQDGGPDVVVRQASFLVDQGQARADVVDQGDEERRVLVTLNAGPTTETHIFQVGPQDGDVRYFGTADVRARSLDDIPAGMLGNWMTKPEREMRYEYRDLDGVNPHIVDLCTAAIAHFSGSDTPDMFRNPDGYGLPGKDPKDIVASIPNALSKVRP